MMSVGRINRKLQTQSTVRIMPPKTLLHRAFLAFTIQCSFAGATFDVPRSPHTNMMCWFTPYCSEHAFVCIVVLAREEINLLQAYNMHAQNALPIRHC